MPEQEIEPQLIFECLTEAIVESLKRTTPNYIYQAEEEIRAQNTWSRKCIKRTITQEAILAAMESTYSSPTARQCASRKSPRQLLCDLANVIMDANGEILKYLHLMALP